MPARKNRKSGASKKRNAPRSSSKKAMPATTRVIATLVVAAVFVGLLYSLARVDTAQNSAPEQHAVSGAKPADKNGANKTRIAGSDYSFYSLLKDFEVKIPSFGNSDEQRAQEQATRYLIQAGSFKTENQAEQQRAELILLGLTPTVEKTTNSRGEQWFRILLGPYDSRSEMAHARSTLISNRFDAMVMKRNP